MASLGAKVLQTRSVELAMTMRVPVRVSVLLRGAGQPKPARIVCDEERSWKSRSSRGVAYSRTKPR
jgi:aspartate kinase